MQFPFKLIKNLRGDKFVPKTSFFPDLDTERLIKELNPEGVGIKHGKLEQPSSEAKDLDHFERTIVEVIDHHRRKCVENFDEHLELYEKRADAINLRTEIEMAASQAPTEFKSYCKIFESEIQDSTDKLRGAVRWRETFKQEHGIDRLAHRHRNSLWDWLAIGSVFIIVESCLNAYLFATKNELGLVGGIMVALLISAANVVISSLCGYYSRYFYHHHLSRKLCGALLVMFWVAFVSALNFGAAHFRDGIVDEALTWDQAAEQAVKQMRTQILDVASIESWLLFAIGSAISFSALLKAFYFDDPYPGYGKIERTLEDAREGYSHMHRDTLVALELKKENLIDSLREAEIEMQNEINDTVSALFGNSSLESQIRRHIEHCNDIASLLLQIYRDHNEQHRTTSVPNYFRDEYKLPKIDRNFASSAKQKSATKHVNRTKTLVTDAVKEINSTYDLSISNFPSVRDIEATELATPRMDP